VAYFNPDKDFFYGEWVTVSLSKGIIADGGANLIHGYTWNFWTVSMKGSLDLIRTDSIEIRQPGEGWIQTYGTYAGDLDGDGWSDFIVPNEIPNDIRVFMNDGSGGYNDFTIFQITNGARPSPNEGMDFNLDGLMDFAVGNSTTNKVTVFMGDGTGNFSSIQNYTTGNGTRGLSLADVNGNGFMDIITTNRIESNVSILTSNGDGSFAPPINFEGNGNGETDCATVDVNGDGILDLYIGALNSSEVILFFGDGDGGFTYISKVTVGSHPWQISAGDVNDDGIADVVSANSSASTLSVVFADVNGNLSSPVNYPTGSFPLAIDLGDLDGDGDLEVITSNFSTADYTLYENDGSGNYINRRNLDAVSAGSCCVLHDRDNDGDMDITAIDELEDLLILFENDYSLSVENEQMQPLKFSLEQNYPNPFNPGTMIMFNIKKSSHVILKVYDVLGKEITTLVNEEKPAGEHEVLFKINKSQVTSGVFFYQLSSGSFTATKKMILLK
jgi:hypothetical protein